MAEISLAELTGQTERHLVPCWSGALVHKEALAALVSLRDRARQQGFELAIASSFRSFERQLAIWQQKASGARPLLAADGSVLDSAHLSDADKLDAILRWSALPGLSRHHWGTDFDVYDAAAIDAGYQLQLTPAEYSGEGPFAAFSNWLAEAIQAGTCCGYYRPYALDRGGVAPEPWHISYRPVAERFEQALSFDVFRSLQDAECWPLNDEIRRRAEEIFQRYVHIAPLQV